MILTIVILSLVAALSLALNVAALRAFYRVGSVVLEVEEAIEEALDSIDASYVTVGKILQLPLATNDPKVVQVHLEMKKVHASLLRVAHRLTSGWPSEDGQRARGEQEKGKED